MTLKITIIGAGAAGMSTAIELADKGYEVLLIERNTLGSGASGRNPGRMGHGFHYTDVETALSYLRASIKVQRKYPGFLLAENIPDSPLTKGRYFITKDSNPDKHQILKTYEQIKEEYLRLVLEDPSNKVFGEPENFYRILDPEEYQDCVNMELVDIGIETHEHLFLWEEFVKKIKSIILKHPNIELLEHTNVLSLQKNKLGKHRFLVEIKKTTSEISTFYTDYIINSTWENIEYLNAQLGITMPSDQRTNRLKTLLIVDLPEELKSKNSMFFCMGQHCMMSNMGDGRAMMTYAKVTNIETCSDLKLSENAQRLICDGPTQEETEFYAQQIIHGVSFYIPAMKHAEVRELKFGIVQTLGKLSLEQLKDPEHQFHKRSDHNIRSEQLGLISNPCMKLFYFVDNAEIVSQLIDSHVLASKKIDEVIQILVTQAKHLGFNFNPIIERRLREKLEQSNISVLLEANVNDLAQDLMQNLSKINLMSNTLFFAHEVFSFNEKIMGVKL